MVNNGYTAEEGRKWCPPHGFRLTKDHALRRWRIESKAYLGGTRQKAWGNEDKFTDYSAMLWCIELAWAHYCRHTEEPCPFEFSHEFGR